MAKINVLVVYGGRSVEHDISILSALIIMKALKESDKYQIIPLYLTKDNEMITFNDMYNVKSYEYKMENDIQVFKNKTFKTTLFKQNSIVYLKTFKKCSHRVKIDLIYPILHGFGVEDGTFKGWCDILGVTAVTSPIAAAALLQDKELTKLVLNSLNVDTLPYEVIRKKEEYKETFKYPVIIKPAHLGSSIGISVIHDNDPNISLKNEIKEKLKLAFIYDNKVIIEPCLTNFKEYSIAAFSYKNDIKISNVEEIRRTSDIYTFEDKYCENKKTDETSHRKVITLDQLSFGVDMALEVTKIYNALNLMGIVRFDYLYDIDTNKTYLCEINTIPGSLAYYLFEKEYDIPTLFDLTIKDAMFNKQNKEHDLKTSIALNLLNMKTKK